MPLSKFRKSLRQRTTESETELLQLFMENQHCYLSIRTIQNETGWSEAWTRSIITSLRRNHGYDIFLSPGAGYTMNAGLMR